MNWDWTPRRVYDRLGYDEPEAFAVSARAERYTEMRDTTPHERLEQEKDRCTGRTTVVLAQAVAHAMNGYEVVLVGRDVQMSKDLVRRATDMLLQLATPMERGQLVWNERMARLVAHSIVATKTDRYVVLHDHADP